ncbi:phage tail tape measure protein [Pseudomonas otitidis]|uniref:Phage tail tape measure protein n=1 Tax=Metapseudomonas otitidis TaxID=319939 RepID=A0ABU3XMY1_9GAMM|nr:phage tail tape measure protein [Pseudomonas otitidis]MDV3438730.1 phage tail tape measure protein [Pseudomonas otitidis]MDV3438753.1 phage tail tape measure protein [Pseudomonas otitidis]
MSDVQFTLGVDDAGGIRQLDQFRKAAQATFEALKKPGERITVFNELQQQVDATGKALTVAKTRVRDLAGELIRVDSANSRTAASLREVTANVRTLESNAKALDRLQFGRASLVTARDRVRDLGNELARAAEPSRDLLLQYQKAVNAYRTLQRSVQRDEVKLQGVQADPRALQAARAQMQQLTAEQQRSQVVLRQLQGDYRNATRELDTLTTRAKTQGGELGQLRTQLRAAGVDTTRLAAEQVRLRAEMAKAVPKVALQAAVAGARESLGVRPFAEINSEVTRLQRNFQLLKASGQLSATELTQAHVRMLERTRELTEQTNGWRTSLAGVRNEVVAGAAAFGGIVLAGRKSFSEFADFTQQMAGVESITELTSSQIKTLSQEVRTLSTEMGKPAAQSAAALRDILGSGIATERGLEVLGKATKAAIAGMTDTKTAASVGVSVLNAYGESVDMLDERYDQLFLTVQDGVVEFDELAAGIGQVLPSAAAAKVGFDEIGAAIARMTVQGIKAPIAITGLRSAITQLSSPSPEAAKAMKELGIQWDGLAGTLRQIAAKKLGPEAMRSIVPDIEGRTAVLALVNQMEAFNEQLLRMEGAAGSTERAYNIMKDTPQQQVENFKTAVNDLQIAFGQVLAAGLPLVNGLTDMLNAFNELDPSVKSAVISLVVLGVTGKALSIVVSSIRGPFSLFLGHLRETPAAAKAAGSSLDLLGGKIGRLGGRMKSMKLKTALRGSGWLTAGVLFAEWLSLKSDLQKLANDQAEVEADLAKKTAETAKYADVLIKTAGAVQGLSEDEKKEYAKQLQMAEEHWRLRSEQISRQDLKNLGPNAPVSKEALQAANTASEYRKAYANIDAVQEDRLTKEKSFQQRQDKLKGEELTKIKTQLAAVTKEHEEANKNLEEARKKRLEIQKRFQELVTSFTTQKGPEASFGSLNQAKISARDALRAGDTDKALAEAERAAKIMEDLREAGTNTYGFAGIAKELQQIANAAAQMDERTAESGVKAREAVIEQLLQKAEALKRISVGFVSDGESEEATRQRMLTLAGEWQKYMQVKVVLIPPDTSGIKDAGKMIDASGTIPGHANGTASALPGWAWVGENGPELLRMRGGEQVLPSGLSLALDSQARNGGLARNLPEIPQVNSQAIQPANPLEHWGAVDLGLPGGGSAQVLVHQKSMPDLLRLQARMRGSKR